MIKSWYIRSHNAQHLLKVGISVIRYWIHDRDLFGSGTVQRVKRERLLSRFYTFTMAMRF